jgi:hypothetical protein
MEPPRTFLPVVGLAHVVPPRQTDLALTVGMLTGRPEEVRRSVVTDPDQTAETPERPE